MQYSSSCWGPARDRAPGNWAAPWHQKLCSWPPKISPSSLLPSWSRSVGFREQLSLRDLQQLSGEQVCSAPSAGINTQGAETPGPFQLPFSHQDTLCPLDEAKARSLSSPSQCWKPEHFLLCQDLAFTVFTLVSNIKST